MSATLLLFKWFICMFYTRWARSICLFVCLFVCQHFVDSSVCGTMACHWMYQFISAFGLQWSQHRIGLRICALIARLYRTRWQVTWVICKTWELLVWDWMLLNTFQEKTWQRSLRRSVCSKASTVGFFTHSRYCTLAFKKVQEVSCTTVFSGASFRFSRRPGVQYVWHESWRWTTLSLNFLRDSVKESEGRSLTTL